MKGTKAKGKWRFWRKGGFDAEEFEEDKKNIIQFYNNQGFRDAEILSDSLSYDDKKEKLYLKLTIREGNRYKIGEITFEGNELFNEEELLFVLGIKPGDDYNEEALDAGVYDRLTGLYMDKGYIYVNIQPLQTPSSEDVVDIGRYQVRNSGESKSIRQKCEYIWKYENKRKSNSP